MSEFVIGSKNEREATQNIVLPGSYDDITDRLMDIRITSCGLLHSFDYSYLWSRKQAPGGIDGMATTHSYIQRQIKLNPQYFHITSRLVF